MVLRQHVRFVHAGERAPTARPGRHRNAGQRAHMEAGYSGKRRHRGAPRHRVRTHVENPRHHHRSPRESVPKRARRRGERRWGQAKDLKSLVSKGPTTANTR